MGVIEQKTGKKEKMPDSLKNVLIFLCIVAAGGCILAAYLIRGNLPLDRLLEYRITVSPGKDGSLEITYSYQWEVLNDSKEGPLTWVSLGVPNSSCTLLGYEGAIAGLHSAYTGGGLMEFDLDREYGKGEVADFSFTIHQERMLCSNKQDASLPYYDFAPGWFDNMEVEHYRFTWEGSPFITETNADRQEGADYVWEGSLKKGERLWMKLYYEEAAFTDPVLVEGAPASGHSEGESSVDDGMVMIILLFTIIVGYKASWGRGKYAYGKGRGYYGGYHGRHGGPGSGCACACAGCACACACAGGGRAGCSRKDFYHTEEREDENDIRGSVPADQSCAGIGGIL